MDKEMVGWEDGWMVGRVHGQTGGWYGKRASMKCVQRQGAIHWSARVC